MAKQIVQRKLSSVTPTAIWSGLRSRYDSFINTLTGIGIAGFDRTVAGAVAPVTDLADEELAWLYDGDDLAASIVDRVPEDALRQGYEIEIKADDNESIDQAKRIAADVESDLENRLHATERLADAWSWGRAFGGGMIYLVCDEGGDIPQSLPLNENRLRSIESLVVLDKRDLTPHSYYEDPANPKYGEVETYLIHPVRTTAATAATGTVIHETRFLRFGGARTTIRKQWERDGWDLSVLQRPYDVLREFNLSFSSLANLLQAASQGVFKMQGLIEMISAGNDEIMQRRMGLVDVSRGVARSLVMDAELESYEQIAAQFSGVPDSLRVLMLRLSSAARQPLTVLFGQSPAGMNATGESDRLIWAQTVETEQHHTLKPVLTRLAELEMMASNGPTRGNVPDHWDVCFPPLVHMTEEQHATIRKTIAETDQIYLNTGVLLPEEIAINRFGPGGWTMATTIDTSDREELLTGEPEPLPSEPTPKPSDDLDKPADPTVAVDPQTAFNGAQVTALKDLAMSAQAGEIPRSAAIRIIAASYPLTEEQAERILEDIKQA